MNMAIVGNGTIEKNQRSKKCIKKSSNSVHSGDVSHGPLACNFSQSRPRPTSRPRKVLPDPDRQNSKEVRPAAAGVAGLRRDSRPRAAGVPCGTLRRIPDGAGPFRRAKKAHTVFAREWGIEKNEFHIV